MQKFLLISLLVATFVIPSRCLRRSSSAGFRDVLTALVAFMLLYVPALLFIYPRLS
jgi:hypothetical protein